MYTTSQAALELDISQRRVRALIAAGRLSAIKPSRDWLIQNASVDTYVPRKTGRPKTIKAATAHETEGEQS